MKIASSNFLFLIFITFSNMLIASDKMEDDYEKYVNEIINEYVKEVEKKYSIKCIGSGGSMPYDVESIDVRFYKEKPFSSIGEARKLELELLELLTMKVNCHKKIKSFLREYPFPISRSRIGITVYTEEEINGKPTDKIVFLFQTNNKLFYQGYDGLRLYDLYKETYEEALKANEEYLKRLKKQESI